MLEVVHMLIKYVKRHDVFICEFIDVMKSTKVELHGRPTLCWFFVNMMILLSMSSLLFVNIKN
jgi:hypothetical protein